MMIIATQNIRDRSCGDIKHGNSYSLHYIVGIFKNKAYTVSFGTGIFKEACITMFNMRGQQQQQQ
jgi:hypothetical protein